MLYNYIRITFRHLWHHKLYAAINTTGLAVGIACLLLAMLYVKDERSYDTFHRHNPHLYRITTTLIQNKGEQRQTVGATGQVQGPAFKAAVPEVLDYTRIMGGDIYGDVIAGSKTLHLPLLFTDENFFSTFSFQLLRGNASTVLRDINAVVITERTARRFFNSIDVTGRLLELDADPSAQKLGRPLVITGVVKDPPLHSSIQFDVLLPFRFLQLSFEDNNWLSAYLGTFVVLHPRADTRAVTRKFDRVYALHAKEQLAASKKNDSFDPQVGFGLQPVTDIHLRPLYNSTGNKEGGVINGSDPVFSYMFLGIAAFILLMAGINFINITIAGSLRRSKEVGVRKVNGSSRLQIIVQFLAESALLCAIAFVLALLLTWMALPLFNRLSGKELLFREAWDGTWLLYCTLILAVIILLTGSYPAWILSDFRPAQVLYNRPKLTGRNLFGRSLVVLQFSLAVFLIIATLFYYLQMDYVRTKDLGYNPHQVIRADLAGARDIRQVKEFLRNELKATPAIRSVAFGGYGHPATVKLNNRTMDAMLQVVDEAYLPALQIPLKAGRNFSRAFATDSTNSVIVNEAFVKAAGLQTPVGAQIRTNRYGSEELRTIVGVAKDFHFGSLRQRIQPLAMIIDPAYGEKVWIKFEKTQQQTALAAWEKAYRKALPRAAFQYTYQHELNAREYLQEQRWKKIIGFATLLSVVICCSGLFGLAHLAIHQRVREIGIRKVLGAGLTDIAALLSKDFLKPVLLAIAIASPLAGWTMRNWLQGFAYHIGLNAWIFLAAALLTLLIALVTVSAQAVKAALANPVESLKAE